MHHSKWLPVTCCPVSYSNTRQSFNPEYYRLVQAASNIIPNRPSSFWEHEAVANYHGEIKFAHPSCITRSILKTRVVQRENGESMVAVTAHGYRGVDRVDYEEVYGGDGEWHEVPVHWTEYLPVQRTSNMCLSERGTPSDAFRRRAAASGESAYRRFILSFLARK